LGIRKCLEVNQKIEGKSYEYTTKNGCANVEKKIRKKLREGGRGGGGRGWGEMGGK
jgi:hypothetical protein